MKRNYLAVLLAVLFLCPFSLHATCALAVSAQSAVLMEAQSGQIAYQKDAQTKRKPASTTKIMTACVVLEAISDLTSEIKVDARAVGVEGSSVYLKANEKITIENLLYALLLSSANDAAEALAYAVSPTIEAFADRMNDLAKRIGLNDTHFMNPHGLDHQDHYTTALDLARLTRYAMQNETFCRIVSTKKHTVQNDEGTLTRVMVNHNRLLRAYPDAVGVKTGFTKKSGRCLVSAAKRDGVTLIAVTLNAPNDWADHSAMLDYGFSLYENRCLLEAGEVSYDLPLTQGSEQTVRLSNVQAVYKTVKKTASTKEIVIEAPKFSFAPVENGAVLGCAKVYLDDECVAEVPLTAQHDVAKTKPTPKWKKWFGFFKGKEIEPR
jgi:D-alanyl-D-alanine carboxypeptidase